LSNLGIGNSSEGTCTKSMREQAMQFPLRIIE